MKGDPRKVGGFQKAQSFIFKKEPFFVVVSGPASWILNSCLGAPGMGLGVSEMKTAEKRKPCGSLVTWLGPQIRVRVDFLFFVVL